jgi:hypothetical protein
MSKQPGDRYPSAGDLGRAAVAALSNATPVVPERTVATGAAATVEPETMEPEPEHPGPVPPEPEPTAPTRKPEPTEETGRLRPEPPEPLTEPDVSGPKRSPLLIGGGLAAVIAVAVVALVLASGGGGDGGSATGETTAPVTDTTADEPTTKKEETPPEPKSLTRAELATQADAICSQAKTTFKEARADFPEAMSEELFDVGYSEALVAISTQGVKEFKALDPPASERGTYRNYLDVQERIKTYDSEALEASRAEDNDAYLLARERRNLADPERWGLAAEMGFDVCSGPGEE